MPIWMPGPDSRLNQVRRLSAELGQVEKVMLRVRYLRLQKELLEGVNPEINTDGQALVSRMEELGFRPEIVNALHELERKIYEAGKPLDFKGCMELARTIFEEIVEDAGRRAARAKQHDLPPRGVKGNFTPWKKILVATEVLSGDEGGLFESLYVYLSNAGTHRLGSKPEQVRVTRNMVIECGLLVVGRVQTMG